MTVNLFINGKKVTQKYVKSLVGEQRYNQMIEESKTQLYTDPFESNDYMVPGGVLHIKINP